MTTMPDSSYAVLEGVRRRGQFLIASLLWACAAGFLIVTSGYLVLLYHYGLGLVDRVRAGVGSHPPSAGPDWFLLAFMAAIPLIGILALGILWAWYKRIWNAKLREVWPDKSERWAYGRWRALTPQADDRERSERMLYLTAFRREPATNY